jgi:hypothetical protein
MAPEVGQSGNSNDHLKVLLSTGVTFNCKIVVKNYFGLVGLPEETFL